MSKPTPNHAEYLRVLRRRTPEERLSKAFELTTFSRELLLQGLRSRFSEKSEAEVRQIARERLDRCRKRSY